MWVFKESPRQTQENRDFLAKRWGQKAFCSIWAIIICDYIIFIDFIKNVANDNDFESEKLIS